LYSIVAEVMVRHGVLCRLQSISLGERWFKPALLADVLAHEGFTGPAIAGKVLEEIGELGALSILDETLVDIPDGRGGPSHPAGRGRRCPRRSATTTLSPTSPARTPGTPAPRG